MEVKCFFTNFASNKNNFVLKMKAKLSIIGTMICLLFLGCKSEKEQVRDKIEQMKSRPIELCLNKMECRRNPLNKLDKKYTMVVYVDSTECSSCALSKLRFWNPLIAEAKKKQLDIDYVFILAPKKEDMEDVNVELEITDLQSSIYVDTAFVFKKNNKDFPKENKYHSFLLNTDGKVIFIGSPIANKKVMDIYKNIVNV